jgi:Ca2+-transporting ATPase
LKAAQIGIAMGKRGTDVAREASALVLLDDDFAAIPAAIRLGRRIYDNLRKAIAYIIAVHIPIAGLALMPLLAGMPLMLMPIEIALLEMIIDPACSVVFEAEQEEPDVMSRPPRQPGLPVLPRKTALWALGQGCLALAVTGSMLHWGAGRQMADDHLRALVFTLLVLLNIGLIFGNRASRPSMRATLLRPNKALGWLVLLVMMVLGTALYWRPAQELFHLAALSATELGLCVAASLALIAGIGTAKAVLR